MGAKFVDKEMFVYMVNSDTDLLGTAHKITAEHKVTGTSLLSMRLGVEFPGPFSTKAEAEGALCDYAIKKRLMPHFALEIEQGTRKFQHAPQCTPIDVSLDDAELAKRAERMANLRQRIKESEADCEQACKEIKAESKRVIANAEKELDQICPDVLSRSGVVYVQASWERDIEAGLKYLVCRSDKSVLKVAPLEQHEAQTSFIPESEPEAKDEEEPENEELCDDEEDAEFSEVDDDDDEEGE
jgi:hypothetical protein